MIKQVAMYFGEMSEEGKARAQEDMKKIISHPNINVSAERTKITPTVLFESEKEMKAKDFRLDETWVVSVIRTYRLAEA